MYKSNWKIQKEAKTEAKREKICRALVLILGLPLGYFFAMVLVLAFN